MRYAIILLVTLGVCFGVQSFAVRAVGGRTAKSESNYFSSLGRIQAGTVGKPEVMLLGSSMTGRLPDRAQGFPGFANMGCDGGSAVDALRAMDRSLLPTAPILVIEANTLGRALDPLPSEVGLAMDHLWFQAGMKVPFISAYARPAAFIYSALLARKIGGFGGLEDKDGLRVTSQPSLISSTSSQVENSVEQNLIKELVPLLKRLQAAGSRIIFVWLPPGRPKGSHPPAWVATLVTESNSEWWDLGTEADQTLVSLTDGVHMASPTAARTVISLQKVLQP